MSNITKEDLQAFSETNNKVIVLFEKILATQEQVTERQEKITARLYNGLAKDIASGVIDKINSCAEKTDEKLNKIQLNLDSTETEGTIASRLLVISKDSKTNKGYAEKVAWFVGIIGLVIIICEVILKFFK